MSSGALDCSLCTRDSTTQQPVADPVSFGGSIFLLGAGERHGYTKCSEQTINPPFVHGVACVCGGQCVLSVNGDGSVNLFDALTMELLASVRDAHASMIGALHVADDDGSTFLTGGNDKVVQAWVITAEEEGSKLVLPPLWKLLHVAKINAIAGPSGGQPFDGRSFGVADTSSDIKVYGRAS